LVRPRYAVTAASTNTTTANTITANTITAAATMTTTIPLSYKLV